MRIAIVGGGIAGLATAWMLQDAHDVTVLEKEPWLGGHARSLPITVDGKVIHAETGFKYMMFPQHRRCFAFLDVLGVPVRHWMSRMTLVFEDEGGRTLVLPPRTPAHVLALLGAPRRVLQIAAISWFPRSGQRILHEEDWSVTLAEHAASRWFPPRYGPEFLLPFMAANWGGSAQVLGEFAAYDVLRVLSKSSGRASDIDGGSTAYINALVAALPRVKLQPGTAVDAVRVGGPQGVELDVAGVTQRFDHVILATPSEAARDLLERGQSGARSDGAVATDWIGALEGFTSFDTHIVIHGDRSLMPRDRRNWGLLAQFHAGGEAFLTEWCGAFEDVPVFRTWLPPGRPLPTPLFHEQRFRHLIVTPGSRARQLRIQELQGRGRLSVAGMYATDVDIHESALLSAMNLAERLNPESAQLRAFRERISRTTGDWPVTHRLV